MRILIIAHTVSFPEGMAATQRVRLLASGLVAAGHEVLFYSTRATDSPPNQWNSRARGEVDGVRFEYSTRSPIRSTSFALRRIEDAVGYGTAITRIAKLLRSGGIDVVYAWSCSAKVHSLSFVSLCSHFGVPVFCELSEHPWSVKLQQSLMERHVSPLRGMSGVVAISHYLEDWARQEAERRQTSLRIVRVPIVCDTSLPGSRSHEEGRPLVLYAASAAYGDSLRFLLQAMRLVWVRAPECRLVVTACDRSYLESQLGARGWNGIPTSAVETPGYLPRARLHAMYSRARALLIPMPPGVRSEARFPTKIAEYAMAGRPIIASAVGEVPRFFADGRSALIAPPDDLEGFARRVLEVIDDPRRASAIGRKGREVAVREFDYLAQARRLARAFKDCSDECRTRGC